jgi:hypothetical protein
LEDFRDSFAYVVLVFFLAALFFRQGRSVIAAIFRNIYLLIPIVLVLLIIISFPR